jgi:hypothetical protein
MNFTGEMEAYYHSMHVEVPARNTSRWMDMYEQFIEHVIFESAKMRM